MRAWLFPIEPLVERYSAQWAEWFPRELRRAGCLVHTVDGDRLAGHIRPGGQFLDVVDTNYYKARQLSNFTILLEMGQVKDGDWVIVCDAWNPAVGSLAYMRDLGKVHFKIAGLFHAGSYDPWDLLGQSERVRGWAEHLERGWVQALDRVFVATCAHRRLFTRERGGGDKVEVTGFPLFARDWLDHGTPWRKRERIVVFPHRIAPEKDPAEWELLARMYRAEFPDDRAEFVRTKDEAKTKADYYSLLGRARVAVSTAKQETWGIAMLEAASLGCHPVAPRRLSYPEVFGRDACYMSRAAAVRQIRAALDAPDPYAYDGQRWETAIENMVHAMKRGDS